jgi:hypothetical protein
MSLEPLREKRKVFAKTVFDIREGQALMEFIKSVVPQIGSAMELDELLQLFWPAIYEFNTNNSVRTCKNEEALKSAAIAWLSGDSFADIMSFFSSVRFGTRNATIDHIVEVCENGFGYQGSMIIGACLDLLDGTDLSDLATRQRLRHFQKALKYGLPTERAIIAYEIGMSERSLAIELSKFIPDIPSRTNIIKSFKKRSHDVNKIVDSYPSYFSSKLLDLID